MAISLVVTHYFFGTFLPLFVPTFVLDSTLIALLAAAAFVPPLAEAFRLGLVLESARLTAEP